MKHQYESEILFRLMERDGFNIPSSVPPYEAEIKAYLINQVKQAYPKLMDYEAEWLLYNYTKHLPADFPISSATNVTKATFENVVPFAYQSAILKGSTKYRDIDTGEILDVFDETKNLELVSVQMPVLTTSNEDGTKTNILTVNEDVTLRGIGGVQDTLDLLTGELKKNISDLETLEDISKYTQSGNTTTNTLVVLHSLGGTSKTGDRNFISTHEIAKNGRLVEWYGELSFRFTLPRSDLRFSDLNTFISYIKDNPFEYIRVLEEDEKSIKTVELKTVNESGESVYFIPLEGTMIVQSSGEIIQPTFDMSVPVEAITQNLASFIDLETGE